MSSPAGPPPLLSHDGWRLESGPLGDGRSKSGLRLHSVLWQSVAGEDRCPPPRDPLLSSATMGGDWKVARWVTAGVNPASGSTRSYGNQSPVRTDVLPRGTPSSPQPRWVAIGKWPAG